MALLEMLTEFIFTYTTPTVSFGGLLIIFKLVFQMYTPMYVMTEAIHRRAVAERITLVAAPFVFFLTYIIMDIVLGGCFLNGGFSNQRGLMDYIVYKDILPDVWTVIILFLLTSIPINIILKNSPSNYKKSKILLSIPGTVLTYVMFIFCTVFTMMIQKNGRFPSFVSQESSVLWYTYSIYSLLFQVLLNLTAIVLHILFSNRSLHGDIRDLVSDDGWCKKQVRRFFVDGYKVSFFSFLPFAIIFNFIMLMIIEEEADAGRATIVQPGILIFVLALDGIVLYSLYFMIRPSAISSLKRMEQWGNPDHIRKMFLLEFFDGQNPPLKGNAVMASRHFILTPIVFLAKKLYYSPDFTRIERDNASNPVRIHFKDGSSIRFDRIGTAKDLKLVEYSIMAHRKMP